MITLALALIGSINHDEKPIKINNKQSVNVFKVTYCLDLVNLRPNEKIDIIIIAATIVPELKGRPIAFTKNTSRYPNNLSVDGSNTLKINSRIATEITLAIMNCLTVILL